MAILASRHIKVPAQCPICEQGAEDLFRCGFSGRPWRRGEEAQGGGAPERRDVEDAAVGVCGLKVEDLAISGEVDWRWP